MPNTYVEYTSAISDQVENGFEFSFPYLNDLDGTPLIDVYVNGTQILSSQFSISASKIVITSGAVAVGNAVRIVRNSVTASPLVDFVNGSVLTEESLDDAYLHNYYLSQEAAEGFGGEQLSKLGGTHYNANNLKIINLAAPTDDKDAATKNFVENYVRTNYSQLISDDYDYGSIASGIVNASFDYGAIL